MHPETKKLLEFDHRGYECLVTTNGMGFRCGYLRVPVGHPWHNVDYNEISATCHGGLTFAAPDEPCDKGGDDNAWWVGFDCGHAFDLPDFSLIDDFDLRAMRRAHTLSSITDEWPEDSPFRSVIRTTEYVTENLRELADQAAIAHGLAAPAAVH